LATLVCALGRAARPIHLAHAVNKGARMRWLLCCVALLPLTSACLSDDTPTISIWRDQEQQNLQINYDRPYGHHLASVTATVNGLPMDVVSLTDGRKGETLRDSDIGAQAVLTAPLSAIDRGILIELTEGGDVFTVEVPDYAAPRAIHLHSPIDVLVADQWLELDSGVPSDALVGSFELSVQDHSYCFGSWDYRDAPGTVAMKMPPPGANDCGTTDPAPGTTIDAQLHVHVQATVETTRCDGPDLVCKPFGVDLPALTAPTTLAY
jgi:hypothetical protein